MVKLAQFQDCYLSKFLISQLQSIDEKTGNSDKSDLILQEIEILEGKATDSSSTKIPTQYKHLPLKGLWHKHFFWNDFIPQNLYLHFRSNGSNIINQVFDSSNSDIFTEDMVMNLLYESIEGGMEKRADEQKLTGEWIIYAKYEGKNYYLTLALHNEDDHVIHKRIIDHCKPEFPFLF